MSQNTVLVAQQISVGYGHPLHAPFSFSLKKGEFLSLIGANGSGKSTILKTLIKELEPLGGVVCLEKTDMRSLSHKEVSRAMSALFTVSVKTELLTCRDVVAAARYPYTGHFGLLSQADEREIDKSIALVKAEDFAQNDFMKVSDGQRQRILFARALCQNPKVLVLDEPTSYLDIRWRREMLSVLRDLCKTGVTVIASLHEVDTALKVSDRILCVGTDEVTQLSQDESKCKQQICALYELNDDFFAEESGYAELVRAFCKNAPEEPAPSHPSLMIQGTMSNAGKSFLVAGLCRIFRQDGFSVAPFKSQNMALNSFVTSEGLEMGRAQVMQAEAAGIEPSVLMNPILLKPTSDTGSQVIVNGEVVGNMSARDYFAYKKSLVPQIARAYETLAAKHDIIVLEGAGSPAEINLKENDIVNMGMAQIADAPVLLVADIDRGGVFAQLVGTVELLTPAERSRVKGFVINKFRGDASILESGIKMLEERTGIPVVGTVPYVHISLDDEDSLSENLHTLTRFREKNGEIQLAVVRLPHVSNFTDFNPLARYECVNLYYVSSAEELGTPDAIILPGTKNTLADLDWLKKTGIAALIQAEAKKGTPIVGICGGFQMLGEKIYGTENGNLKTETEENFANVPCVSALGLLPIETEFSEQKTRTRVSGKVRTENGKLRTENCDFSNDAALFSSLDSFPVSGYEIHMGHTRFVEGAEASFFARITDSVSGEEKKDGAVKGNVAGTYIHGLFDETEFCEKFIALLAMRTGKSQILNARRVSAEPKKNLREFKESQYNLLADTLRMHLDMEKIYKIIGVSKRS